MSKVSGPHVSVVMPDRINAYVLDLQVVQQDAMCLNEFGALVACVENRRWQYNGVTYITLNIPGSCNNLCDTNPDPAEFAARNAANIKWMRDGFAAAVANGSVAVMIISQADPGWDLSDITRAPLRDPRTLNQTDGQPDGYYEFLTALRDQVVAFDKPVAYVLGDSHYFRIDTPLLDARGRRINHFTRVETPGNNAQNGNNDVSCVIHKLPVAEADFRNLSRRATARRGLVAADHSRCSQIGRDILYKGGNAADAAVATALCQGVVNPVASGLGGGAFIMVRWANGSSAFIDGRETAPAAAHANMYDGLDPKASLIGPLAVAVPGELQGLGELWRRYGSKPWADLVTPAVELARSGFAAHPYLVYVMSGPQNEMHIASSPELREAFMIQTANGTWRLPHVGELCCKRPKLADTLAQIGVVGPGFFSQKDVATSLAAELAAGGGIISANDLATAAPAVREPLQVQLGELELLLPPPPSSAAVVAFALKFLAGYADGQGRSFGAKPVTDSGVGMHRLVEAMKHGFAIRTALGDPGTPELPFKWASSINAAVSDLLNDTFIDLLRSSTTDDDVMPDTEYGGRWNPKGVTPAAESGTSHFCVVDKDRNAVSVTTSVNTAFGSTVVSPSTGILWGNTMDDFAQPNKSSIVTPHPTEANFIEPGKRPLSAMSPVIVTNKTTGKVVAVTGASGGPLIVSATLQTLARLLLEGADVSDAVLAARVHDQLLPADDTYYENYTWSVAVRF
eukprot:gene2395-2699_t